MDTESCVPDLLEFCILICINISVLHGSTLLKFIIVACTRRVRAPPLPPAYLVLATRGLIFIGSLSSRDDVVAVRVVCGILTGSLIASR